MILLVEIILLDRNNPVGMVYISSLRDYGIMLIYFLPQLYP